MKSDPVLSSEIYRREYDAFNYGTSLAARFMRRCHAKLEARFSPRDHFSRVLEVGSGSGQHVRFVRHGFDEYHMTDLSAAMWEQTRATYPEELRKKIVFRTEDATALSYPDESFDRLIGTHVLEHLPQPHRVLREWHRVVRAGGTISIVLPCDPGMLWRLGRHLGPRRAAAKLGMEYDYFAASEHVNSIFNLVAFIRYYFERIDERWYPLPIPLPDLTLFYLCHIRK